MKIKKTLGLALTGILCLSFATPVFAAAGGAGADSGEENSITISYRSLTKNEGITDKVGPSETVINNDLGYAWDDLSFTYVQTLGGGESSLTTDDGYDVTNPHFISGAWYRGSYADLNSLDEALENDASIELPVISLGAAAMGQAVCNAEQFASFPKIVLHNYQSTSATYSFGIANEDVDKFNANGMLTLINEQYTADEVTATSGTLNGNGTVKYGVAPIGAPSSKDFSPFTIGLTISIN